MPDVAVPAAPPLANLRRVELIHTGRWPISSGQWQPSREDLIQAVAALDCPAVRRPILKLGHSLGEQPLWAGNPTGAPAVGWVDHLALTNQGHTLVGDFVGMPGWLGDVAASAYPDRSVESKYDYRCQIGHTHPFVLTAVALLGVTPPGVGTLRSLQDVGRLYGVGDTVVAHLKGEHNQEDHGNWADGPGASLPDLDPADDKLGLAGRIRLDRGERLVGSSRIRTGDMANYQNAAVLARIATPDGPRLRLGIVDAGQVRDDTRRWSASNRGGTVNLDAEGIRDLRDGLNDAIARGKQHQKVWRAFYRDEDNPDKDPGRDPDEILHTGSVSSPWGDLVYELSGVDDEDGGWLVSLAVRPPDAGDDWEPPEELQLDLLPAQLRRLTKDLDATLELSAGDVAAHMPGRHDQSTHGRRYGPGGKLIRRVARGGKRNAVRVLNRTLRDVGDDEAANRPGMTGGPLTDVVRGIRDGVDGGQFGPDQAVTLLSSLVFRPDVAANPRLSDRLAQAVDDLRGTPQQPTLDVPLPEPTLSGQDGETERRIRQAVADVVPVGEESLDLADLRALLPDIPREDLDRVLVRLGRANGPKDFTLERPSLQRYLTRRHEDAAVRVGTTDATHIRIAGGGRAARAGNVDDADVFLFGESRLGDRPPATRAPEPAPSRTSPAGDSGSDPAGLVPRLRAAGSRDEARQMLAGLTVAQLRAVADQAGIAYPRSIRKPDLRDLVVQWTVGRQLDSQAISRPAPSRVDAAAPLAQVQAAADVHTGAMVALLPSGQDARRLAVDGGEPAGQLHATLLFLGDAGAYPAEARQAIVDAVRDLAEVIPPGEADGMAISAFNPDKPDKDTAIVVELGGEGLDDLHGLVEQAVEEVAAGHGLAIPEQHTPYRPHVTLLYDDDLLNVARLGDRAGPVRLDRIRVAFAGENVDIPLAGEGSDLDDLAGEAAPAPPSPQVSAQAGRAAPLRRYWLTGKGALKIRWGTSGDFGRCVRATRRYLRDPEGYCAELHHEATGQWPGRGRHHAASAEEAMTLPNPNPTIVHAAAQVTVDDVRTAFYQQAGQRQWIREFHTRPQELIVADDGSGGVARVAFQVDDDGTIRFGKPKRVRVEYVEDDEPEKAEVAASRMVYASAAESRPSLAATPPAPPGFQPADPDGEVRAARVSDRPWSDFDASDYSPEQWRRATLLDRGPDAGDEDTKSRYALPVREPSGVLNRNGVHAAAGGHGIGALKGISDQQRRTAARKLVSLYRQIGDEPPESLLDLSGMEAAAPGDGDGTVVAHLPGKHNQEDHGRRKGAGVKAPSVGGGGGSRRSSSGGSRSGRTSRPGSRAEWLDSAADDLDRLIKRLSGDEFFDGGKGGPNDVLRKLRDEARQGRGDPERIIGTLSGQAAMVDDIGREDLRRQIAQVEDRLRRRASGGRDGSDAPRTREEWLSNAGSEISRLLRDLEGEHSAVNFQPDGRQPLATRLRELGEQVRSRDVDPARVQEAIDELAREYRDLNLSSVADAVSTVANRLRSRRRVSASADPHQTPAGEPGNPSTEEEIMPLSTEVYQRLGLAEDAEADAVNAAVLALADRADQAPDPKQVAAAAAEKDELTKEVGLLKGQVQAMSAKLAEAEAAKAAEVKAGVLDTAQREGKFAPAQREQWEQDYDAAPAAVTRVLASIAPGTAVPVSPQGKAGDPLDVTAGVDDEPEWLFSKVPATVGGEGKETN